MGLRATRNLGVPRAIPVTDAGPGEHTEPSLAWGGGPRRPVVPSCPGGLIGRHVAPTTSGGLGNPCVLSLRSTAARAVRRKPPCAVRRSRLTHRKRQRARPPRAAVCLDSRDVARGRVGLLPMPLRPPGTSPRAAACPGSVRAAGTCAPLSAPGSPALPRLASRALRGLCLALGPSFHFI